MTEQQYQQTYAEKPADDADRDPEAERLVSEIEETRSDMGATIDEIGHRLQPQTIANEAREKIKEATVGKMERIVDDAGNTAQKTSTAVMDTVRQNPVPAALAGIGIGWLVLRMRDQGSSGNGNGGRYTARSRYAYGQNYGGSSGSDRLDGARSMADDAVGRAQDLGADVQDAAQSATSNAQQTMQDVGWQAQQVARDAQRQFDRTLNENPLAVAALAVGVGAAIALALPTTRREQEMLGEPRDRLVEKAGEAASQALDEVQTRAEDMTEQVQSEA